MPFQWPDLPFSPLPLFIFIRLPLGIILFLSHTSISSFPQTAENDSSAGSTSYTTAPPITKQPTEDRLTSTTATSILRASSPAFHPRQMSNLSEVASSSSMDNASASFASPPSSSSSTSTVVPPSSSSSSAAASFPYSESTAMHSALSQAPLPGSEIPTATPGRSIVLRIRAQEALSSRSDSPFLPNPNHIIIHPHPLPIPPHFLLANPYVQNRMSSVARLYSQGSVGD